MTTDFVPCGGALKGIVADPISDTFWAFSSDTIFEVKVDSEGRNVRRGRGVMFESGGFISCWSGCYLNLGFYVTCVCGCAGGGDNEKYWMAI